MLSLLNPNSRNHSDSSSSDRQHLMMSAAAQIAKMAELDQTSSQNAYGLTPSMQAAQANPYGIIQSEQFPDILQFFPKQECQSVLSLLRETNNSSLVNKQGPLGGYTALHWMCIKNEYEIIEFLIKECNADINARAHMGETPLLICVKNCNFMTIELLIENGADLQARDIYGRSIIHWSAYTGRVILFYYLQKYHSINNLNDVDQSQQNALHIASACGFVDLIRYLINSGELNLFAQDVNGNTCLHMAAKCGLPKVCWDMTQKNKGDCVRLVNIQNNQNQTPFDLVKEEKAPQ